MPTASMPMNVLDPFIFLNHHGWQLYPPSNQGLPFGPHPHRGFETVTFILEGDLMHEDSNGGKSIISAGGIQWMVAGKGLIHAEVSSASFKAKGGPLEILQLWVNLPASHKMTEPAYQGLQAEDIPVVQLDEKGDVSAHLVFGNWKGVAAPFTPFTDIHLAQIDFKESGLASFSIAREQNIFCYIVKGNMLVNDSVVEQHQLVEFEHDEEEVILHAITNSIILLGFATPFKEPFVAYGPFVMNSKAEIQEAYKDYKDGKLGNLDAF